MSKLYPYGEIFKMPELLDKFSNLYGKLLVDMEKPVYASIEEARKRVFSELEGKQCHDALANKFVELFDEIKEKTKHCNNVATLQNIRVEADALKVRLLNEIAFEENIINLDKIKVIDPISPQGGGQPTTSTSPMPKVKKQKTVSIKSINLETTWQLESEQDVQNYVDILKSKLLQSLEEDTIINVEF